jgi:hypothetical protein
MAPRDIVDATTKVCIECQRTAAAYAADAMYFAELGVEGAAKKHQESARIYHDAAWDRLSRLIGVS